MQQGLDDLWPYVAELFDADDLTGRLVEAGIAVDPTSLQDKVIGYVTGVLEEATLVLPQSSVRHGGGRRGIHTEHMGYVLAEMQYLHRAHPGATW